MLDKIEQLAEEKAFESLSHSEKAMVLSYMPREEYDQIRRIIQTAGVLDASVAAPERMRANLLAQFPKSKGGVVSIWLALGILAAGWWLMWQFRPVKIQIKEIPVTQVKTDTVWLERVQWREKVVYKTRVLQAPSPNPEPLVSRSENKIPWDEAPVLTTEPPALQHLGTSLGDMPELMSFFTQGDKDK
ncbi:MAG TPA: hypothetical protein DCF33_11050 [Saprospirales bacterium]|nr:hypothetical protein [Saprospirales bacterium]